MKPIVFSYRSFSSFFADYYEFRKATDRKFSYRWLGKKAEIRSYSLLCMIAKGERKPTPDTAEKIALALDLPEEQVGFSRLLAEYQRTESDDRRSRIEEEIMETCQMFSDPHISKFV